MYWNDGYTNGYTDVTEGLGYNPLEFAPLTDWARGSYVRGYHEGVRDGEIELDRLAGYLDVL